MFADASEVQALICSPLHSSVVDAVRLLDITLGATLALALIFYGAMVYRDVPSRHSVMALLTSFWLVNLAGVLTSIARLSDPPGFRLPIRLLGHMIGIVFVVVAYTMVREGRRPL